MIARLASGIIADFVGGITTDRRGVIYVANFGASRVDRIDADGRLWVIDWDDAMIAPKECDLMMVVGGLRSGLVSPEQEGWFRAGYGEMQVDRRVLAFYRHARALSDITARVETVLLLPGLSPATRSEAVNGFARLFEPGAIVDLAGRG